MNDTRRSAGTRHREDRVAREVRPISTRFHQLRMNLRRRFACEFEGAIPPALIRRALDEAEEVALQTGFPHLFFPELASEQVRRVSAAVSPESVRSARLFSQAQAA
jgi:hypothetical protein